jgi:DNA-binding response OmpR family regulator
VVERAYTFLVVDYNADGLALLARTLQRKFPSAIVHQSDNAERAVEIAEREPLDAIITHRVLELTGEEVVRMLRASRADVPIIMVSGMDRRESALAAGANYFLPYDEWLNLGTVIAKFLGLPGSREPGPASGSSRTWGR